MKRINKFNKNILLFVFAAVFIIGGMFSIKNVRPILGSVKYLITGEYTVDEAKNTIELTTSEELLYHNILIDINSLKENALNTHLIKKDDSMIVKNDSGYLGYPSAYVLDDNNISQTAERISNLKRISEDNGAHFLYCQAPAKEYYYSFPSNIINNNAKNKEKLIEALKDKGVPYLDFMEIFEEENIPTNDLFYRTDHHWKEYPGFVAYQSLCKELKSRYGFEYSQEYADYSNYNVKDYPDCFLGSIGRQVGRYFTWQGLDDFRLITPKFETNMTEEQPIKDGSRSGTFEESVLYMENISGDVYKTNQYATYSGGDFRLQIMKNNLNPQGKKILLIRDSFACVVAPFLALQTSELHICDMRDLEGMIGDRMNMEDYIKEIQPDYVVVLYTDVGDSSYSRYDFFFKIQE